MQDLFTDAFSKENERLGQLVMLIPQTQQEQLSELITREEGISKLNIIRSDQKNFQYTAVKAEVDKALKIADLYEFATEPAFTHLSHFFNPFLPTTIA